MTYSLVLKKSLGFCTTAIFIALMFTARPGFAWDPKHKHGGREQTALDHLNKALIEMQSVHKNEGGHRDQAINLINQAIKEIEAMRDTDKGGAWSSSANFNVTLYNNNFHKVLIQNFADNPCRIQVTVRFYSPDNTYYKWKVKVTLKTQAWLGSQDFYNNISGEREFTWVYNTADQGCFGQQQTEPSYLEVHGCVGEYCTPAPF
jgi:hypothetical protein